MKNKKIVLALSLVLALGATMVAGGSLAWFSDTDETVNTFTVGRVEITQNETNEDGSIFSQNQQLIPVSDNNKPKDDANFIHKQVTVMNTGENAAYIQTYIAVPTALDNGLLRWDCNLADGAWEAVDGDDVVAGIQPIGTMVYEMDRNTSTTENLNIYLYRYEPALEKGVRSPILLNGVYINQDANVNVHRDANGIVEKGFFVLNGVEITDYDLAKIDQLPILVATQAVQAQGFTDAETALARAFLDHPWANP